MYIQLNSQVICYEKTGEGSPVILIHGNKGDHHTFDALAETMSQRHTVYAMDTRGHGESATPKEYHYRDMAEDVINLINALDIENPYVDNLYAYWFFSSTRRYTANKYRNIAIVFYFTDTERNQFQTCRKDEYRYVCAVHTF